MRTEETTALPLLRIAVLCFGLLLCLLMGIETGEAAMRHNYAMLQLVFSEEAIPKGVPEEAREQILWLRENLMGLKALYENDKTSDKAELSWIQAYFYAIFYDTQIENMDLEDFYQCFQYSGEESFRQEMAEQKLKIYLKRSVTEDEAINASELYYRLRYGFDLPSDGTAFDNWVNQLPADGTDPVFTEAAICSPIGRDWRHVVSSEFGQRKDPISGEIKGHSGIDLAIPTGTQIYCVRSGTVQAVRYSKSGYGYHVIVNHGNGVVTLYAHCSRLLVREGQKVEPGMVLALSGNTGKSTGPHLHFEVRISGEAQNPRKYLP